MDTMEKKETRITLKGMGRLVLVFLAGFLIGRVRVAGDVWPFGTAIVAAAFLHPRTVNPYMALAGVLTALVTYLPDMNNGAFNFATVALVAAIMIIAAAAKAPMKKGTALIAIGAAYLVATVAFRLTMVLTWAATAIEMVSCMAVAVLMDIAVKSAGEVGKRRVFREEEVVAIVFLLLTMIMGIGDVNVAGVYLRHIAAVYMCLIVAYAAGAGCAAAAGMAMAMAAVIVGEKFVYIADLGFAAMAAGVLHKMGKGGCVIGFLVANVTMALISGGGETSPYLELIGTAAGCAGFLLTPMKVLTNAALLYDEERKRRRDASLHDNVYRLMAKKGLDEVSRAMSGAAKIVKNSAGAETEDISYIIGGVPEEACGDCMLIKSCWDTGFARSYGAMKALYGRYLNKGDVAARDIDPAFAEKCLHLPRVIEAANRVFGQYAVNSMWERKVRESRAVLGDELIGAAGAIERLAKIVDRKVEFSSDTEERVRSALDDEGVFVREVAVGCEPFSVNVVMKGCNGRGVCEKKLKEVTEKACGRGLVVSDGNCAWGDGKYCRVEMVEEKPFVIDTAVVALPKSGAKVSGDAHSVAELSDGRILMLLSDGMGSGERARKESNSAVELIEDLYRAGFEEKDILPAINKLMLLCSSDEIYTTVDRCVINRDTGRATFTKIAAAESYIVRGGEVKTVSGGALPLGILDDCMPKNCGTRLNDGDMIVMATDGVTDILGKNARKIVGAAVECGNPRKAAENILGETLKVTDGIPGDDMTIIVARVKST